jgi:hypothetical protein
LFVALVTSWIPQLGVVMTRRPLRQYEKIWITLKRDRSIRIAAPRPLHKRIIKATMKERYMDLGFKLELAEANRWCRIQYRSEVNIIHIWLKFNLSAEDL